VNELMNAAGLLGRTIPPHNEPECMSAHELAAYLRVNRKTVYEYAAKKVIPCRRLGRRLVFSRPAIVAWLALLPPAATPATP
jgi:excisionase family DNA binding protein